MVEEKQDNTDIEQKCIDESDDENCDSQEEDGPFAIGRTCRLNGP